MVTQTEAQRGILEELLKSDAGQMVAGDKSTLDALAAFETENPSANLGQSIFKKGDAGGKMTRHASEEQGSGVEWVKMWHPDGTSSKVPRNRIVYYAKKGFLPTPPKVMPAANTLKCHYCHKMCFNETHRENHERGFHPDEYQQAQRKVQVGQQEEQTELYRQLVEQRQAMQLIQEQNSMLLQELIKARGAPEPKAELIADTAQPILRGRGVRNG
jgi:hypothetical protein